MTRMQGVRRARAGWSRAPLATLKTSSVTPASAAEHVGAGDVGDVDEVHRLASRRRGSAAARPAAMRSIQRTSTSVYTPWMSIRGPYTLK